MSDQCPPFEFDETLFRQKFQQFNNTACFTSADLNDWWETAGAFVTTWPNNLFGAGLKSQYNACLYMTAHIGAIAAAIMAGQPLAVLTDAAIDKIRVSVKPPPIQEGSSFQYWMNQTPYGQALLALFNVMTVGSVYIGGWPERAAFRHVGGGFGPVPPRAPWPK